MAMPPVQAKTVLVTGCSSGIGAATAHHLRDCGWTVYPTARSEADIQQLESDGFQAIRCDLFDADSVSQAAARVLELTGGKLGALVNNAGFAQAGAIEDIDRDSLRRQFEVNVFGMHQLTTALLPTFRSQGYGRIVNVSSVLGRITSPMLGCYCASKYAMESLSDAMRVELRPAGIWVSIIEPGPIISEFRRNAAAVLTERIDTSNARYGDDYVKEANRRRRQVKKPNLFTRPPEDVAVKIRHALEASRPRRRYCVTIPAYLGDFFARVIPQSITDHFFAKKVPDAGGNGGG
jgi:NAD(P)-dependent dehydrogenase (short-subunit alcohol dehydrogenase family)